MVRPISYRLRKFKCDEYMRQQLQIISNSFMIKSRQRSLDVLGFEAVIEK